MGNVQYGIGTESVDKIYTNLAFFKHVSTSGGKVSKTCG